MRRTLTALISLVLVLGLVSILGCSSSSSAEKAEDFYKGKTITMIVPYRAGGGTDTLARVIASYLETNTGANVVVENRDAAGGLEGHNYMYEGASKDGLTVGVTEASALWADALLGSEGVRYKIDEFGYPGIMQTTVHMLFTQKGSPYNSIDGLKSGKGLKLGVGGAITSAGGLSYAVVIDKLGLDAKIVPGYRGSADAILAMQKGEIDTVAFPGEGMQKYVDEGVAEAVFTVAVDKKYAFYKDVPAFGELVTLTDKDKSRLNVLTDLRGAKALFIPPGVPKDRADFLQQAFVKMADTPQFQDEAGKAMGYWPGYVTGQEAIDVVKRLTANSSLFPELKALAEKYSAAQ